VRHGREHEVWCGREHGAQKKKESWTLEWLLRMTCVLIGFGESSAQPLYALRPTYIYVWELQSDFLGNYNYHKLFRAR
jgi:hypothetical protein